MLRLVSALTSNPLPDQSESESAQRGDVWNREATRPAEGSSVSGQIEQSFARPPEFESTDGHYRTGLVRTRSRVTPDAFDVNQAVDDLRVPIKETVRREFGNIHTGFAAFRRDMKVRFDPTMCKCKIIFWMLGVMVVLQMATLVLTACPCSPETGRQSAIATAASDTAGTCRNGDADRRRAGRRSSGTF